MFWQIAAWIFVPYFIFVYPVVKFVRREMTDREIEKGAQETSDCFIGLVEHSLSKERDQLRKSFFDDRAAFAMEIEDDLVFIFGEDWKTTFKENVFYAGRDTGDGKRDGWCFRGPWQILFHIYCAKRSGHFVWEKYSITATGIDGDIIITKSHVYKACAVIEKYITHHYGDKYLLFKERNMPWYLKWGSAYDMFLGPRPW